MQVDIGLDALPPMRKAIGSRFDTKAITLLCGKLTRSRQYRRGRLS